MSWQPKHKFKAVATVHDGIRFDSKKEGRYYEQLKLAQKSGELVFFLRQAPLHLEGNIRYVIDFIEFWADGRIEFTDVKGMDTPLSKAKRTQAESRYPIKIKIV